MWLKLLHFFVALFPRYGALNSTCRSIQPLHRTLTFLLRVLLRIPLSNFYSHLNSQGIELFLHDPRFSYFVTIHACYSHAHYDNSGTLQCNVCLKSKALLRISWPSDISHQDQTIIIYLFISHRIIRVSVQLPSTISNQTRLTSPYRPISTVQNPLSRQWNLNAFWQIHVVTLECPVITFYNHQILQSF